MKSLPCSIMITEGEGATDESHLSKWLSSMRLLCKQRTWLIRDTCPVCLSPQHRAHQPGEHLLQGVSFIARCPRTHTVFVYLPDKSQEGLDIRDRGIRRGKGKYAALLLYQGWSGLLITMLFRTGCGVKVHLVPVQKHWGMKHAI